MEKEKGVRLSVLLLVFATVAVLLMCSQYRGQFVFIGDRRVPRSAQTLDLRGQKLEAPDQLTQLTQLRFLDLRETGLTEQAYLDLRREMPECEILWSVPFRDGFVEQDATVLTVEGLTREDARVLEHLKSLKTLDAGICNDCELLLELRRTRPELELRFFVELGDGQYPWNVTELELENQEAEALDAVLPLLKELKQVRFTGRVPEAERIRRWMAEYPDVIFLWQFEICGVSATSLDTELILNDIPMESVDQVEAALANFYNLRWVEMCGCGIPSEEMDALWKRHPETRFVWTVQVGRCTLRTDTVSFMPYQFGYDGYSALWDIHTGELKYCVDMVCLDLGHMEITDYSFLEYMPKLKYLILADTPGTDFSALAGLKELVFLEIFMTQFDQAEVLVGLTKLEDLNIGNSRLDNVEPLLEMTWLKRLWLPGNVLLDHEERRRIVDALPDTQVMYACAGSTGEGWRESPNYFAMRDMLNMGYMSGW